MVNDVFLQGLSMVKFARVRHFDWETRHVLKCFTEKRLEHLESLDSLRSLKSLKFMEKFKDLQDQRI